ncbi:MAG: nucleotidyltransferase substrate binding protein [bacterium]
MSDTESLSDFGKLKKGEVMNNELRWKQRLKNFEKAYSTFCRILNDSQYSTDSEMVNMALVKSFEFTYELAWNTMKDYLENEGYDNVDNSKKAIRTAFRAELIKDPEVWMEMVQKRNLTSHIYNATILKEAVEFIKNKFYPEVEKIIEVFRELA